MFMARVANSGFREMKKGAPACQDALRKSSFALANEQVGSLEENLQPKLQ
jgi:hypothetical protein